MPVRISMLASLATIIAIASSAPALAAGEVIITQAKALAGNITKGDAPGFPVTIHASGSYQLGSNLQPGPGKNGIEVTAGYVGLDFNGFTLSGGDKALNGIVGGRNDLRIRNGAIVHFKNTGIENSGTGGVNGDFWSVEGMTIAGNGGYGIHGGYYLRLLNSTVAKNGYVGVMCVLCHIEGNIISSNGDAGAYVFGGTVLGNEFQYNKLHGLAAVGSVGYGNNNFANNSGGGTQVTGMVVALHPNACGVKACP